jgi:tetratricopeptide (TPR) repeat protein
MPASSSSSFSRISRTATLLGVLGLSLLLYGCSDMITFAQQDRETGVDSYNRGDYAKAAGAFRAALRQDPRDYMSHYYLGLSSLQLHNYQQALVAFRSCIDTQNITLAGAEDNGTRLKAMDGLAQAIMRSDDGDLEVNKIEQIARNARGSAASREFMVLAKVYRYRLLPDMAIDYYDRAITNDPKNFDFAKEYGLYCEQLQQTAKARSALEQAYALNVSDRDVTAALLRLGIIPGPSLRSPDDLAKPLIPKGPIPEVDMAKVRSTLGIGGGVEENRPAIPASGSSAAPRD